VNWQLSRIRHSCLECRRRPTYHPSRTLRSTSALLLQQQPATASLAARAFCAAAPIQSGPIRCYWLNHHNTTADFVTARSLLVSTPVQLIRFWHLRTGLKLNSFNLATCTRNCFWRHRSAPDSLANWHVGCVRNLFVLYCIVASVGSCAPSSTLEPPWLSSSAAAAAIAEQCCEHSSASWKAEWNGHTAAGGHRQWAARCADNTPLYGRLLMLRRSVNKSLQWSIHVHDTVLSCKSTYTNVLQRSEVASDVDKMMP